ncbi:hypothetical protein LNP74_18100 [Klebsiella pneumoniae subsp. pneumoniae]|nr:hypothetical protein [Klebsiella pneumoniae subsp. pneumoniae]
MMVAVDFQRLADHQLNLERRLILLLRQLNNPDASCLFSAFGNGATFSSGWSAANAPADMQAAVSRETASVVIFFTVDHPFIFVPDRDSLSSTQLNVKIYLPIFAKMNSVIYR